MPYRNDHEALRGRVRTLEGQLRETREQLEQLRTPSPRPTKTRRSKGRGHNQGIDPPGALAPHSSTGSRAKISKWMATLTVAILVGVAAAGPYMLALGPFTDPLRSLQSHRGRRVHWHHEHGGELDLQRLKSRTRHHQTSLDRTLPAR